MGHRRHRSHRDDKGASEPDKISKRKRKRHHSHKADRKPKREKSKSLSKQRRDSRRARDVNCRSDSDRKFRKNSHKTKRRMLDSDSSSRTTSDSSASYSDKEMSNSYSSRDDSHPGSRKRLSEMGNQYISSNANKKRLSDVSIDDNRKRLKDTVTLGKHNRKIHKEHGSKLIDACHKQKRDAYDVHLKMGMGEKTDDHIAENMEIELRIKALANLQKHRNMSYTSEEKSTFAQALTDLSSGKNVQNLRSNAHNQHLVHGSNTEVDKSTKTSLEENVLAVRCRESSVEEGEIRGSEACGIIEAPSNLTSNIKLRDRMDSEKSVVMSKNFGTSVHQGDMRVNEDCHIQAQAGRATNDSAKRTGTSNCASLERQKGATLMKLKPETENAVLSSDQTKEDGTQSKEEATPLYQEKTMSVMRGGEVVQVNYKVYIPRRASELAKRKLQR